MGEKKLTKKEYFELLKGVVRSSDLENKVEVVVFLENEIEAIEKRAVKSKERAAQKRAEGDELRAIVESVLTEEYQSAQAITDQIEGEDVSKQKVVSRLTQLFKAGKVEKREQVVEDKKVMTYKLK